jgi:hypothetical protein
VEEERERTRGWVEGERARVAVERSRVSEAAAEAEERAARDLAVLQVYQRKLLHVWIILVVLVENSCSKLAARGCGAVSRGGSVR